MNTKELNNKRFNFVTNANEQRVKLEWKANILHRLNWIYFCCTNFGRWLRFFPSNSYHWTHFHTYTQWQTGFFLWIVAKYKFQSFENIQHILLIQIVTKLIMHSTRLQISPHWSNRECIETKSRLSFRIPIIWKDTKFLCECIFDANFLFLYGFVCNNVILFISKKKADCNLCKTILYLFQIILSITFYQCILLDLQNKSNRQYQLCSKSLIRAHILTVYS